MGDLANAVDRVFFHARNSLPIYVPTMPALYTGLSVGGGMLFLGLAPVFELWRIHRNSENPVKRLIWILLLGVVLAACSTVSDIVQDKVYQIHMVRSNSQHFANLHWLKQYRKALL